MRNSNPFINVIIKLFLASLDIIATDLDVSVLLMALFAELERHARYLEAFWIYQADHSDCMTAWLKGFPRLTFKMTTRLLKDISARNNVNVPMIGSIKCKFIFVCFVRLVA